LTTQSKLLSENVTAIIFDFDGVIVDSEPLYEDTANQLFRDYGVTIPAEDWKEFKGLSEEGFLNLAREKYGIRAPLSEIMSKDRELLKQNFKKGLTYMPGFQEFYEQVNGAYTTGLVTSSSRLLLQWIFANTPIENHFEYTITAEDIVQPKPHPAPYLAMSQKLNIAPGKMLVIEDSWNGIKSARAAGAVTVAFLSTFRKEDLPLADYYADSFREISRLLKIHSS